VKTKQWTGVGLVVTATALLVGCSTTRPDLQANDVPEPVAVPITVELPDEPIAEFALTDRDDPAEVIRFGVSLGDAGRHDEAAQVFLDASTRFISKDRRLEQSMIQAAIKEHWLAGDLAAVREGFGRLEKVKQRDIYDMAGEDAAIRKIRELVMGN